MLLFVVAVVAFFFYKSLYPDGPVLDEVENPVRDRSMKDWVSLEMAVPKNKNRDVFFGDLHVHTAYSFDAYIGGTIAKPEDAYRFAKGEAIPVVYDEVKIERPLDFAAVTDHSEYFGELYSIHTKGAPAHNAALPRYFRSVGNDTIKQRALFLRMLRNVGQERNHLNFYQGYETTKRTWDLEIEAAEKHYEPGSFTTFAAYEWTLGNGMSHTHRNVFFKDMNVPDYPISAFEARNELELWKSLEDFRKKGSTVMAVPHNMNLSNGTAFPLQQPDGNDIDQAYVERRNLNEPLAEVHQAKGNSEVIKDFWANDEFSDFENYNEGEPKENNYLRWALKKGLEYESQFGTNPYKYGMIGSTDTHNGTPGNTEEDDDYIGNHTQVDSDAKIRSSRKWILDTTMYVYQAVNPGGLMAVWSEANTRTDIYEAMERRETYATSGGRIKVRFFAGKNFKSSYNSYDEMVRDGYSKGVPMGADIKTDHPEFLIWAAKDPDGANLDRIQVVKGWYRNGELNEKIFNVALSDQRQLHSDGKVPDNGAKINPETGAWDHTKGDKELFVRWSDPEFSQDMKAFYYLRVFEIETPRWNYWDEIKYGVKYPEHIPKTIQERAWSSPIWYSSE